MDVVLTIFERGGMVMWPLLACSLLALTIVFERLLFWGRLAHRRDDDAVRRLFDLTDRGATEEALAAGRAARDPAVRVLAAGLADRAHGLTEAMQVQAERLVAEMKRGLLVLDTIITLAPLLGILGTVTGIIASFNLLGAAGMEDPRAVTGGIAEALITTAAGLCIAIVTLIPFNYFSARVETEARRIEHLATQFEVACQRGRTAGPAGRPCD